MTRERRSLNSIFKICDYLWKIHLRIIDESTFFLVRVTLSLLFVTFYWQISLAQISVGESGKDNSVVDSKNSSIESNQVHEEKKWTAFVLRRKNPQDRIPELEVVDLKLPVLLRPIKERIRPFVELRIQYKNESNLLFLTDDKPVEKDSYPLQYKVYVYLNGKINEITLISRADPSRVGVKSNDLKNEDSEAKETSLNMKNEKIEKSETLYIYAPDINAYNISSPWNKIILFGGITGVGYYQSTYGDFRSVNPSIGFLYSPIDQPEKIGWLFAGSGTLTTVYSSPISRAPQFYSLRGDVSYLISSSVSTRWTSHALLGLNFQTMMPNGSPFGFSNLFAPELGLRTRYTRDSSSYWSGEFRSIWFGSPSDNRQLGFGIGISKSDLLSNFHRIEYGLDFSYSQYLATESTTVKIQLFTIRLGYSI